jgi:toxin-antitoxin system PIN domain toxin
MTSRRRKGAIVGFGFIAESGHLPAYHSRDAFEIVPVADICPARRETAAHALPRARIYADHEALRAHEADELDFVDITAPPYAHTPVARAALERECASLDTNVLVYAHRREVPEHDVARELVRELAEGMTPWAIPWPCAYEFFSVVTNARIWKDVASTPKQAWAQLAAWFAAPNVRLLTETEELPGILAGLAQRPRVRGPVIHDARIAAICLAHGVEKLISRDRDFSLFPELRVEHPF